MSSNSSTREFEPPVLKAARSTAPVATRKPSNSKTALRQVMEVASATRTSIALATLLRTCFNKTYRVIPRKTKTVAFTRSATTPMRTSPEFAATFPAVAAALPATYILGSTNPSAKPPKMPTSR